METIRTVKLVNPLEDANWDARLLSHPGHTFFHSSAWARVMWQTYGYEPVYFTLTEGNRLLGLLPVMEAATLLKGRRGVSLPFTDICELLDEDDVVRTTLLPRALEVGRQRSWKYLELRGSGQFENEGAWDTFVSHDLDLSLDGDEMFAKCDPAMRRSIRKAEREGVRVEIVRTPEAMREFYRLHCMTRRKHGLPPQSFTFFRHIYDYIIAQSLGFISIARVQEQAIAAAVFLNIGTRAMYKYGASDMKYQALRGNNLVIWEAIKSLGQNGYKTLNFGRTDLGADGLRRFKCSWGATERTVKYFRYDFGKSRFVERVTQKQEFSWANRVFQTLPIGVSRLVGKLAYRHMA